MSSPKNVQKDFLNSPLRPYEKNSNFETKKILNKTKSMSMIDIKNGHLNDNNDSKSTHHKNNNKDANNSNDDNKDIEDDKSHSNSSIRPNTANINRIPNTTSTYVSTRPCTAGSKKINNNYNYNNNDNYNNDETEKLKSLKSDNKNSNSEFLFSNDNSTYVSTNVNKYSKNDELIHNHDNPIETSTYVSTNNDCKTLANTFVSKNEGTDVYLYIYRYLYLYIYIYVYTYIIHIYIMFIYIYIILMDAFRAEIYGSKVGKTSL
jgi:hypothetical protein